METTAKPTEVKAEDPIVGLTRRLAMLETIVYRLTEHQHGATGQLYIPFEKL